MINKSDYICTAPFNYTEVHDKEQWLCCPSWLPVDIEQGLGIKENFRSAKAQEVRDSILDGSYKYCDEIQCPYLGELKNNKIKASEANRGLSQIITPRRLGGGAEPWPFRDHVGMARQPRQGFREIQGAGC